MISSIIRCVFASILLVSSVVQAQNVISVDVPKVNEVVYSKELLSITYTIIGSQTGKKKKPSWLNKEKEF
jgi:hypothetical protein